MSTLKENQFPYRLGVDLGTSSVGVAIYRINDKGDIIALEHLDSYIFGEPVAPKEMVTLNTARRAARLIRRQVERKAARLRKIGYIAQSLGISKPALDADKEDVIWLRARAVEEEISLPQLIKVFCHMVKNRGYKGSIAEKTVGTKLKHTEGLLQDGKTLGQLLWEEKQKALKGQPWRKIEEDGTFIYRRMVEEEFERIWREQSKYHPELNGMYQVWGNNMFPDYPKQPEISLHDAFHSALFYQHPIKWELETVGACPLFPEEKRASCAQMAYQSYRLAKEIANLRIYEKGGKEPFRLTLAQQTQLFNYIESNTQAYSQESGVVSFHRIYNFLGLPDNASFTVDRGSKKGLKGNTTLFAFEKAGLLNEWANLSDKEQELVIEFLSNITNMSDVAENEDAYIRERFGKLTANIIALDSEKQAGAEFVVANKSKLSRLVLEQGRGSYSVKGLRWLAEEAQQGHLDDSSEEEYVAARVAKNKVYTGKLRTVAAIKEQESITDPVMSRALAEFHRVMTYITHKYGNPQEIVVELSREIKNSLRRRQFLERQNDLQAQERTKAIAELQKGGVLVSPRNIDKYLLWEEQNHTCPYSGQLISFTQAFDEKQTQVDHIIPRAGDIAGPNTLENKVLAFTQENKDKTNRLPYEWKFKEDIDAYLAFNQEKKAKKKKGEYSTAPFGNNSPLINFVQHLWGLYSKEKKGYYSARERKFKPTQKGARILCKINNLLATPAQIKTDFVNRQNQETAWIGKIVLGWCKDICPKVTPSFGALTAYLRGQLQFDRILPLIRLDEEKPLFDKDDREIDEKKWKELFAVPHLTYEQADALAADFNKYCDGLADERKPMTSSDKQKAFYEFCASQRVLFQFNKRCDYRHHAVDAAVIGLCGMALVQRAAVHNRKYGTLHKIEWRNADGTRDKSKDIAGFTVDSLPLYAALKDEVKKRLTNYVVWHKPDHFPSGRFFDETAYSIQKKDGEDRFVKRAGLEIFIKPNAQKTIANLEKLLFADTTKEAILTQFKERLAKGLTQEEALCGKKDDPQDGIYYRGNKVKKAKYMYATSGIRKFDDNADKKIVTYDRNGRQHQKGYQNYGYACMDFDAETGKPVALVPLWKYQQQKQVVPSGTVRIFAGDILFDKTNKQFYKVQKFSAKKGLMLCLTTEKPQKNDLNITTVKHLKNYSVVSTRKDIAKFKSE